ncbi:MAG: hypothetical protein N4A45_10525 [Flavobacteriales bacterium]|jgi:hypothetical protein|nr:hypothetical protein [Flavobacteriales bacterium]
MRQEQINNLTNMEEVIAFLSPEDDQLYPTIEEISAVERRIAKAKIEPIDAIQGTKYKFAINHAKDIANKHKKN